MESPIITKAIDSLCAAYPPIVERPNIYETPDIPRIIAVNVWIHCRKCGDTIQGNAFWTIHKSATLHVNGPCGAPRGWELCDILRNLL